MPTSNALTGRVVSRALRATALAAGGLVLVAAPAVAAESTPSPVLAPGMTSAEIPAPVTTVAPDGLSVTDGTRVLSATRTADLDPAGVKVTVDGRGYDQSKGIYLAVCQVPEKNQLPGPCGGGADTTGAAGASTWISSNPPPYGRDSVKPYGEGGSFQVEVTVAAKINDDVDCRKVQCAIVTRNDHMRGSDRGQDIFLPISFTGGSVGTQAAAGDGGSDDDGPGTAVYVAAGVGAVVVLGGGGLLLARRRKGQV